MIYRLENIKKIYNGRTVLDIEDLTIAEGEIIGFYGPNGCGKSTMMRTLSFLDRPDEGQVFFDGKPSLGAETKIRKSVTLLTQEPYLLKRSVYKNVAYGLMIRSVNNIRRRVSISLEMVGLDPEKFLKRSWFELSGGEAQRVALAARLALQPRVLLMDEPTASLDTKSTELIQKAALMAKKEWGATLGIVSHDFDWLKDVADRMVFMDSGKIVPEPA